MLAKACDPHHRTGSSEPRRSVPSRPTAFWREIRATPMPDMIPMGSRLTLVVGAATISILTPKSTFCGVTRCRSARTTTSRSATSWPATASPSTSMTSTDGWDCSHRMPGSGSTAGPSRATTGFARCSAVLPAGFTSADPRSSSSSTTTTPGRAGTCSSSNAVSGVMRSAVYDDELVRTPDGWRIESCRCRFIVAGGLADRPDG